MFEEQARVAADVQARAAAHFMNAVDQLLFVRPDKLPVQLRTDQGGRSVPNADNIGARPDLFTGKAELHLDDKRKEIPDETWVVVKIHHDRVDATQIGR